MYTPELDKLLEEVENELKEAVFECEKIKKNTLNQQQEN